jgi:4-hydroxy-4-methyl-2-oxoglutarate aldolase
MPRPEGPEAMTHAGDPVVALARERLSTALLSDTLDRLGLTTQTLSGGLRPLDERLLLCGRARTGDYKDVYHADETSDFYELLTGLVDGLQPGDVPVLACGKSRRIQPWGGTQATAAAQRGAAGCVTDGLLRDVGQIRALGLPCFSAGTGAVRLRGRGRLVAVDVPVSCGGVWVSPGDLVFGDVDGVIVVPRSVEDAAIRAALAQADIEREMLRGLQDGLPLMELYRRHRTI